MLFYYNFPLTCDSVFMGKVLRLLEIVTFSHYVPKNKNINKTQPVCACLNDLLTSK